MGKATTWASAVATAAKGLSFWSPASLRSSQRFVQYVNQFAFVEKYRNPQMQEVSAKTVLEDLDLEGLRLRGYGPYCGQSPLEILVLCGLAKERRPRLILEIGTFQGFTTLLLAQNTPPETRLVSVDLPSGSVETAYQLTEPGLVAKRGSRSSCAGLWEKYAVHERITQILCDSAKLTPKDLPDGIDFIFVDGSHNYEYVRSDTELAFKVLAPGGIVLWDDFNTQKPGVFKYLNELASERALFHVKETDLVFFDPKFEKADDPELQASTNTESGRHE